MTEATRLIPANIEADLPNRIQMAKYITAFQKRKNSSKLNSCLMTSPTTTQEVGYRKYEGRREIEAESMEQVC